MKITEALEIARGTNKKITREHWYSYNLSFNGDGYLILKDGNAELTAYVLSEFDFNYEWEIEDKQP